MIEHIVIVVDGKEDNTLDIVDIIKSLPIDSQTNLIVTDDTQSAVLILSEIKPKTKLTLVQ